ncbi:MAG: hypothetical protein IKE42_00135 [Aquamicrobium sp.]|uniref:hypothetical protein n=1 Tax=Mesorhizobium sp. Pch-S TaxID=2082387 RepID=UPI0013EB7579|nr:hypothetical protein [Mesorhizobium sp. Pch-S]MBR2686233.1 hypothetical protein [Aquamicrobium sp.]
MTTVLPNITEEELALRARLLADPAFAKALKEKREREFRASEPKREPRILPDLTQRQEG